MCIIFYEHLEDFFIPDFRFGIILSLIATWTWAFATLYTKQQAASFNPYFSLGLQMLISGITLISFTSVTGNAVSISQIPWESWTAIAYLIIFGSLLAFIAYLYALQNLPTEQASIYAYINPIVAAFTWLIKHLKLCRRLSNRKQKVFKVIPFRPGDESHLQNGHIYPSTR